MAIKKQYSLISCCTGFLLFFYLFFPLLQKTEALALELNVSYPQIPGGENTFASQYTVPAYLKYIFDAGMFIGIIAAVVTLTVAGVYYFLSPAIPAMLAKAKDMVYGAISGLLILLLFYLIITTINPSLSFFYVEPLKPVDIPQSETPPEPGVYLYTTASCSLPAKTEPTIKIYSQNDLEDLNSRIQSAKIIHDTRGDTYYISVLFESFGYWGKCFYIDPNITCNKNIIPPFASSISIYQYNFRPSGGGITFYREPFYNSKGGSFKVSGGETSEIYIKALKDLNFMSNPNGDPTNPDDCSVPKEKMDCIQWDDKGTCTKRKCPDLSDGNIGSIKIEEDYVVMLLYFGPKDTSAGPWSSCQAFPSPSDKIRFGPNKVKWENIENQNRLPNYVMIFPVEDNTNPDTSNDDTNSK